MMTVKKVLVDLSLGLVSRSEAVVDLCALGVSDADAHALVDNRVLPDKIMVASATGMGAIVVAVR